MNSVKYNRHTLSLAVAAASLVLASQSTTVHAETPLTIADVQASVIEELLVTGRLQSGAQTLSIERMEDPFSADLMGADQISRTGDSNVATALTRVTGVTLNQGKYVYIRGLGERYSSAQLNGAQVPSPELTRNVLPLDIIPSSIVESLKVQKSYSPALPSHFGGGNVNIRTKNVPDDFVFELTLGTGIDSNRSNDNLTYSGGKNSNGLPKEISSALDKYQGNIYPDGISSQLNGTPSEKNTQAKIINRDLISTLNRNIGISRDKTSLDENIAVALGNSWDIDDFWTLGAIVNWSEKTEARSKNQERFNIGSPDTIYSDILRTVEDKKSLASLGVGLEYSDEHSLQLSHFTIENESDEATLTHTHDSNNTVEEGKQRIAYETRFQNRELNITQLLGDHTFNQFTNDHIGDVKVNWYYSDSGVETFIPGATNITGTNLLDPEGNITSTYINSRSSGQFAFLNLQDDVISYGADVSVPVTLFDNEITLQGGYSYNDKSREYYGYTALVDFGTGSYLQGLPEDVLADSNVNDLTNDMSLTMSRGFGTESYIAAQMIDAVYGMVDINLQDTLRITAGARWENYRSALLPIDLLDYTGITTENLINNLQDPENSYITSHDDILPSIAMTWTQYDVMQADTFQLRASYAQTVVRPDLRELSDVTYIDPELNMRVQGNPNLQFSSIDHFDIRGEWYFDGGNNLTASLFYKDIKNPIEQKLNPGSDSDIVMGFYNADTGKIYGLELEGLYNFADGLFASANLTISESEIESPEGQGFTNATRSMTGQSPYVLNLQLGYDSNDEQHSASVSYNIADEKVYSAAVATGHDDAYEDVFGSLDITYSYFPTDNITVKAKVRNLLDEDRSIHQVNSMGKKVTILSQDIGITSSLDITYRF
jgi:TonB-dependent receptor